MKNKDVFFKKNSVGLLDRADYLNIMINVSSAKYDLEQKKITLATYRNVIFNLYNSFKDEVLINFAKEIANDKDNKIIYQQIKKILNIRRKND